ncbi:MAG: TPM domain-containing protein [Candidatus Omnitrophota bacterium]
MDKMKTFIMALAALAIASFTAEAGPGGDVPKPEGWVNDYANVMSAEYRLKLESLIAELERKTSAEIAVVTVESITPYDEKSYARLILDGWKIGKRGKDNGVLVLLAVKERRWRIETGYGEEGILPDGKCGEIGRSFMVPFFKQGKYQEGLYSGVAALAAVISRDAGVTLGALSGTDAGPKPAMPGPATIFVLVILGIFIFFIICGILRKRGCALLWLQIFGSGWTTNSGRWPSGGGGFGGGFGGGGFGGGGGGGGGAGGGF